MKKYFCLCVWLVSASTFAATPVEESVEAASARTLEVNNVFGSVTVTGTTGDSVRVTGSLSDLAEDLDVRLDGSRVIVTVVYPQNSRRRYDDDDGTVLEISAPSRLELDVSTVSARITVRDIRGEQSLESVSGSIDTTVFESEVRASTTSGRIGIEGNDGRTRAEVSSVSGRVELEAVSGEVNAQTVSGSIELRGAALERAELTAVSGSISVAASLAENGRIRAVTTSGHISLDLDGSPAGEYELSTFSGSIDNCFGPEPSRPRFGPPSSTWRFEEADAATQIVASSMSGSIEVCR